jgi:peptide/nickel transport system substrate-binding protein
MTAIDRRTLLLSTAAAAAASAAGMRFAFAQTPKDTVVMAKLIDDIISLDPAESFEYSGNEAIANMYDRLIDYDLKDVSKLNGIVAESWGVGADGKTYTFKIRAGLKFASGNPITAADVVYSLQRAVTLNKSPGFILTQFGINKDNAKDTVKAPDAMTVTIQTGEAVAPSFFYYCLTAMVASVVDSKLVMANVKDGDWGNGWLKANSAGSGPFKLVSYRAKEAYTMERNDNAPGEKPKVRRVVVRHVGEPATQLLLVVKGDADYARNLSKDQLDAARKDPNLVVQSALQGSILYMSANQKHSILSKPEVREALKWLVDYEAIEKNILAGQFAVHQSFLPLGFLGALADKPYKLDVDKAKALLAKAGHPNGFETTMDVRSVSPITDVAQAIQASFAKAGIKLSLIPGDGRQVLTKYRARNHDMFIGRWGPDYLDPHTNAQAFAVNTDNSENARSKTLAWRNAWDDAALTKAMLDASRETDIAKRKAMYEAGQRHFQKTSPFIVMFQETENAAHRKTVSGFHIGVSSDGNFYRGIVKS